jgi:transcriptional regulator with XRE-family HTH domain
MVLGMDVGAVLRAARARAGLDQRRLAVAAGTARTTVVGYETGAQSPTVRQLDRLLAACGLQARVVLEPLTLDVDRLLDEALAAGPPEALGRLPMFASSLRAGDVRWALDGRSAASVHGLALPHEVLAVALVADEATRRWLRMQWTRAWDSHGFSRAPNWEEEPEYLERVTRQPVLTKSGFLQLRLVADELPGPLLQVQVEDELVPVLPLVEVRSAHRALAELLDRHEHRMAEAQGRRTV